MGKRKTKRKQKNYVKQCNGTGTGATQHVLLSGLNSEMTNIQLGTELLL